jgi:hypothetical protein
MEGEDVEMQGRSDERFMINDARPFLMVGFICVLNFLFSFDPNYNTRVYLLINSILYMILAIYVYRKRMDILGFTIIYSITIVIIYLILSVIEYVSFDSRKPCPNVPCPNVPCPNVPCQNSTG